MNTPKGSRRFINRSVSASCLFVAILVPGLSAIELRETIGIEVFKRSEGHYSYDVTDYVLLNEFKEGVRFTIEGCQCAGVVVKVVKDKGEIHVLSSIDQIEQTYLFQPEFDFDGFDVEPVKVVISKPSKSLLSLVTF